MFSKNSVFIIFGGFIGYFISNISAISFAVRYFTGYESYHDYSTIKSKCEGRNFCVKGVNYWVHISKDANDSISEKMIGKIHIDKYTTCAELSNLTFNYNISGKNANSFNFSEYKVSITLDEDGYIRIGEFIRPGGGSVVDGKNGIIITHHRDSKPSLSNTGDRFTQAYATVKCS